MAMTSPPRSKCPAAPYVHPRDRHMVTEQRWTLTDPTGVETIVCSLACVITVACRWLPADVGASGADTDRHTGEEAA
jgi:hypothetical protein